MYVSYLKQRSEFQEIYFDILRTITDLDQQYSEKLVTYEIYNRYMSQLFSTKADLQTKINQYKYYDIFDLCLIIEFNRLSDDLI